jgi:hypothetical protein
MRRAQKEQAKSQMNTYGTGSVSNARPTLTYDEFERQQAEAARKATEQVYQRIGPFSFDYDDDIESEVLDSKQVYDDLKELEEQLEKNAASKDN